MSVSVIQRKRTSESAHLCFRHVQEGLVHTTVEVEKASSSIIKLKTLEAGLSFGPCLQV